MPRRVPKRLVLLLALGVVVLLAGPVVARRIAREPVKVPGLDYSPRNPTRPLHNGDLPLPAACRASGIRYPPRRPRVLVEKADRRLSLYSGTTLVKDYSIGLGRDPVPDKEREGDRRTPTGDFRICTRLAKSQWHRFLGFSYPAPEDAARGLEQGLLTSAQAEAIPRAHRTGGQPPSNTPLGGEIGLHGGGSGADWTWGCIALENSAVEELFEALPLGTPVTIR